MPNRGIIIGLMFAGTLLEYPLQAQQDFSNVQIRTTQLTSNIYMLEGSGGNIGVSVGPDGVLMVDDQFAPLADRIRAAIDELGEGGELRYVLNTHWHGDHTGGNVEFAPEAPIIAHDNVRTRLATEQSLFGRPIPPAPPEALPVITFDQSMSLYFNGEEIRAMHFPNGHTDGDIVIFFTGSNVAHLGDHFFSDRFPFIDIDSGGSLEGLTRNIGEIIERLPADVQIIPGHGPLSTLDDLIAYRRMLVESASAVGSQMGKGKSLGEIKSSGVLDEWDSWGKGFISMDKWIETVHRSLSMQKTSK